MITCLQKISSSLVFVLSLLTSMTTDATLITPSQRPLSTQGNQIVDVNGDTVRLMGVSWFGLETSNLAPHGLWSRNYKSMMDQMITLGFNTLRIPFCNQAFDPGATANSIDANANPDLIGLSPIQVLDKIIAYADQIGLCVILDHHRSEAGNSAQGNGLWYTSAYPESRFINDWQMLATRYKNNISVIGFDLHNEPHASATWGDGNVATDWAGAAQRAGNAVLAINPDLLIIVEGIEFYNGQNYWWGGNLMGVKNHPVTLSVPNKVVYSPHDYPNSIYSQPWFSDPTYPNNLPARFNAAWGYIFENGIAPVWVGEFGSKLVDSKDIGWMDKITAYLNGDFSATTGIILPPESKGISWCWWSWNPNSGDTGGILRDDWQTPDQVKLQHLAPLMTGTQTPPPPPPPPATEDVVKIQYYADATPAATHITPHIRLINVSDNAIALSDVKIRYWFNKPSSAAQNLCCSQSQLDCTNFTGYFVNLTQSVTTANNYAEIVFAPAAGQLAANASVDLNVVISASDFSTYNQTNDYSYDGTKTTFTDWTHITAYYQGNLVWGQEPTTVTPPPPPASNGCMVQYDISSQWNDGFTANVTITNASNVYVNGWELDFTFPGNQQITNLWNGVGTYNGNQVKIVNASYNSTIAPQGQVSFGFQATYSGTNAKPTSFTFNGVTCS